MQCYTKEGENLGKRISSLGRKRNAQIDCYKLILIWNNTSAISYSSAGLFGSEVSSNKRESFSFTKLRVTCML